MDCWQISPLAAMTGPEWLGVARWALVVALAAIGFTMLTKVMTRRGKAHHLRAWLEAKGWTVLAVRPAALGGAFLWAMPWHGVYLAALEGEGGTTQGWVRVNGWTGAVTLRPLCGSRRADALRQMLGGAAMGFAVLIVLGLVMRSPGLIVAGIVGGVVLTWGCFKAGARNLCPSAGGVEKALHEGDASL